MSRCATSNLQSFQFVLPAEVGSTSLNNEAILGCQRHKRALPRFSTEVSETVATLADPLSGASYCRCRARAGWLHACTGSELRCLHGPRHYIAGMALLSHVAVSYCFAFEPGLIQAPVAGCEASVVSQPVALEKP